MTRLALALSVLAAPALAQDFPATARNGNDTIEIVEHGTAEALVIYVNHRSMASHNSTSTVQIKVEDHVIVVDVTVAVNKGNLGQDELVTVTPRGGYISIPDQLSVPDGEAGEFRVMLPMY